MNLENLSIENIEKTPMDLSLSKRDLISAQHSLDSKDFEWVMNIGYNAVLQASRQFIFSMGYRPIGMNQHRTVFLFLKEVAPNELVDYFDIIRKLRNKEMYEITDMIHEDKAIEILEKSKEFVNWIGRIK